MYRGAAEQSRNWVRKAKAHLELDLAGDAMKSKKGFYTCTNWKREVQKSISPLVSNTGSLVTMVKEKAAVLSNLFDSVFTGNCSSYTPQVGGSEDGN